MEAENRLTLPQETINEIFFKEEARRIYEAFPNANDPDPMHCLRTQLHYMKMILGRLTLPWDRFIPVLFRCFAIYMKHAEQQLTPESKAYQNAVLLMDCMSFLSQKGAIINNSVTFLDYQIKELDKLMAKPSSSTE